MLVILSQHNTFLKSGCNSSLISEVCDSLLYVFVYLYTDVQLCFSLIFLIDKKYIYSFVTTGTILDIFLNDPHMPYVIYLSSGEWHLV